MINILDKRFKYTDSSKTDIRKTFERERKRLKEAEAKKSPLIDLNQRRARGGR